MVQARTVILYSPCKTAMQSGRRGTGRWRMAFPPLEGGRFLEPLMGWTSSIDSLQQLNLTFDTLEEARRYAEAQGWEYEICSPHEAPVVPKSYASNFR